MHESDLLHVWEKLSGWISKYNHTAWNVSHTIHTFATGENPKLRKQAIQIRGAIVKLSNGADPSSLNADLMAEVKGFVKSIGSVKRPLTDYEVEGVIKSIQKDTNAMFGSWDNWS